MARVLGVSKPDTMPGPAVPSRRGHRRDEVLSAHPHDPPGLAPDLRLAAVQAELRDQGEAHSRKRIARLMRQAGLVGACHRRGGPVTRGAIRRSDLLRTWSTDSFAAD